MRLGAEASFLAAVGSDKNAGRFGDSGLDVDLIFKVAGIGIIVAVLYQVLARSGREDQAMMTALIGLVAVMMIVVTQIGDLFETVERIFGL